MTEDFVRSQNNPDLSAALDSVKRKSGKLGEIYGMYRQVVNEWLPGPGFDLVVQNAVLRAYRPVANQNTWFELSAEEAYSYEVDAANWSVPLGVSALARLIVSNSDVFGHRIFTTNFDPLLEVAIAQEGGRPLTISLKTDGSFSSIVGSDAIHVVHLHGYWRPSSSSDIRSMLHEPQQLRKSRPNLQSDLAEFLRSSTACAVGYGGWDDIFVRTLAHVAKTRGLEIMWAFYPTDKSVLAAESRPIVQRFAGSTNLISYSGVDSDTFFPSVEERVVTVSPESDETIRPPRSSSTFNLPAPAPLVPQNSPGADGINEVLRVLNRVLNWHWDQGVWGSSQDTRTVFWPVRLRRPSIIHATQAVVAATLSSHGAEVVLCLDDLGVEHASDRTAEFREYCNRIFATVPGAVEPTVTSLWHYIGSKDGAIDEQIGDYGALPLTLPETPWRVTQYYLGRSSPSLADVLKVSKIANVPSNQYQDDEIEALLGGLRRLDGNKVLTPVVIWSHLHSIINASGAGVLTLGGYDEEPLWKMWESTFGRRIGHLYNPRLANLQQDSGILRWEDGRQLRSKIEQARKLPDWDKTGRLIHWLYHNTILLRASLDQDYRAPLVGSEAMSDWDRARRLLSRRRQAAIDVLAGAVADFYEPGTGID